ncbi:porin family protein [Algivirga pacifica]|uniref:Outer membrane protein beta-barrel domain-containing protein n=1 Tax=Algivirga pacifica TaxID=1162670 RepID=A0ABP9CVI7_9BACT
MSNLKLVLFFSLCILSCHNLFAQQNFFEKGKFALGVRGAASFPTVSFSPNIRQSNFYEIGGGLTGYYFKEKNLGLQAEINLDHRGFIEASSTEELYQRTFTNISVPVLTHLYVGTKVFHVFAIAGPQVNFLYEKDFEALGTVEDQRYDYADRKPEKLGLDLVLGGGLAFWTGIGHFMVDARFFIGMSDLLERPVRTSSSFSYSQGLTGSVAYLIPISGWKGKKEKKSSKE